MEYLILKNGVVVEIFPSREAISSSSRKFMVDYDTIVSSAIGKFAVGDTWTIEKSLTDQEYVQHMCDIVDGHADSARLSVVGDALRIVEYQKAAEEARAFADAGYPAEAVPRTVAAWAVGDRTPQQAADDILAESAAYTNAMYEIRDTRLIAKEQIRALNPATDRALIEQFVANVITELKRIVTGVGNSR